jgi:hypothetical protein
MQKSMWRVIFLLVAIAGFGLEVMATPIVSQLQRNVSASADWNVPPTIQDTDLTNLPGPADLSATATAYAVTTVGGPDFVHAQASQQSTVDAFGFTYTSTLEADYLNHGNGIGGGSARSFFTVRYDLEQPYSYQFTRTTVGTFSLVLNSVFQGTFPMSGVLQPGSYTIQISENQFIVPRFESGGMVSGTATATLQLTPVPEGDLDGYGLLLAFAIGGVFWMSKSRSRERRIE